MALMMVLGVLSVGGLTEELFQVGCAVGWGGVWLGRGGACC